MVLPYGYTYISESPAVGHALKACLCCHGTAFDLWKRHWELRLPLVEFSECYLA